MVKNVNVDKGVLTLKAYESLEKVANGQATKIIIPSEIQGLAGLAMSASEIVKENSIYTKEGVSAPSFFV